MDKRESTAEDHQVRPEPPSPDTLVKKLFIKPEISVPVDVLEATTFFQGIDSGVIS
jgi:hypothetical protein